LILLEEIEIAIVNVTVFERPHDLEENIQVSGPFTDNAWDRFCG